MMGICIQFVPCMLLFLCGSVLLLLCKERIDRSIGMGFYFVALGLLTSYFDLLTFPTVTLTIPLLILYSMDRHENKTHSLLPLCICWGLGYSLMWSLKWLLNGLTLDASLFGGVLAQLRLRISSSSNGVQYTRIEALMGNIRMVFNKPACLLAFSFSLIITLILGCRRKMSFSRLSSLLLPIGFPLLFMLATANHIYDHGYFTYRNLTYSQLSLPFGGGKTTSVVSVSDKSAFSREMNRMEVVNEDTSITENYVYLPYQFYTAGGFNLGDTFEYDNSGTTYSFKVRGFVNLAYGGCNNNGRFSLVVDDKSYEDIKDESLETINIIYDLKDGVNNGEFSIRTSNNALKVNPNAVLTGDQLDNVISNRTFIGLILAVSMLVLTSLIVR